MIKLVRANQEEFYLNPFHIERIEINNYVIITLTNDKKYIVKNSLEDIDNQITLFWNKAFNLEKKKNIDNNKKT